ncbi:protein-tyrosine phosphatase family protein [Occultella kanbiaonis]|uniref:protein-tyrosine phosphatase family protein n=1 Tax=Occultella kanbiaonis TaxID=2675754 RepID=UPI0012B94146|nr:protein-tyrosine phosphatase family protein [Occultella kanbiaonis]
MSSWDPGAGVVEFPDGRRVRGTGWRRPRGDVPVPDFAVYLLGRDPRLEGWPYRWVRWRDFGLPASTEDALDALREAHRRAASERVEIACGAGVGRTGTALAVLAIEAGMSTEDAVGWVREHYHPRAVETRRQRRWLTEVARLTE